MPWADNTKRIDVVNPYRIIHPDTTLRMEDFERLIEARRAAGYETATRAAQAMGIKAVSYTHHENGTRGLSRSAQRYASFFRVSLDWLLSGKGSMKPKSVPSIDLVMYVGAGAAIHRIEGDRSDGAIDEVDMPRADRLAAVKVRGDSQYPRYLDGEVILIERDPIDAKAAVNSYAVVELQDGRQLLKIVRRGTKPGYYRIESHNAAPEDDVKIERAFLVRGSLT